ncbi:PspC domain-containing protein [Conchiformibius steedae]|uniref:PspC domain-containing protein n=1 Tax=Conchiformibius steedae TaxID=153493 RepID=UPI0026EEA1DD|nr:PspC domain-containing protein [Conchiformibius steedae]
MKKLHRSRKNKMLFGVCGGLAEHFNTDPSLIRIVCVAVCLISLGFPMLILYVAMGVILPAE